MSQETIPKEIDRYEVLRLLGAGAMGSVYEARHKGTGRRVAVKLIKAEVAQGPEVVQRFQREARAAGAIASEHITQVLDSGTDAATGAPFLVMELLSGEDLHVVLRRLRPMRPDLALRIVAQALAGLERAHAAKVVHRDIKPPNLFLARRDDGSHVVKLCDFGIAKVGPDALSSSQNASLTHTSALLGSPNYMSPEQAKGAKSTDARTDLWSMGVVLYELLVGQTPYPEADTLGLVLLAICSDPPADVQRYSPWVPPEVAAVVKRAMTGNLTKRYQTAREMLDAVLALTGGETRIETSMLEPMSDDELLTVAPLLETTDSVPFAATVVAPTTPPPAPGGASAPASGDPQAVAAASNDDPRTATANAYARTGNQRAPASRGRVALAAILVLGVVGIGAGLYGKGGGARTPGGAIDSPSAPSAAPSAPDVPPSLAPLAPSSVTAPAIVDASLAASASAAPRASAPRVASPIASTKPRATAAASTSAPSASSAGKKTPPPAPSSSSPLSRDFN